MSSNHVSLSKLILLRLFYNTYIRDENLPGLARPRPNGPAQPGPGRAGGENQESGPPAQKFF